MFIILGQVPKVPPRRKWLQGRSHRRGRMCAPVPQVWHLDRVEELHLHHDLRTQRHNYQVQAHFPWKKSHSFNFHVASLYSTRTCDGVGCVGKSKLVSKCSEDVSCWSPWKLHRCNGNCGWKKGMSTGYASRKCSTSNFRDCPGSSSNSKFPCKAQWEFCRE